MDRSSMSIKDISKKINLVLERYGVYFHTEGKIDVKRDKKIKVPKLILIRGLPGSGKSTFAKELLKKDESLNHYEADMYFIKNKKYEFDVTQIGNAHSWCQTKTMEKLLKNESVIVSNTFTQIWELQPYLNIGTMLDIEVIVYCVKGEYLNIHGVPEEVIDAMKVRWEDYKEEKLIK